VRARVSPVRSRPSPAAPAIPTVISVGIIRSSLESRGLGDAEALAPA
jgi:hypothetical protein